MNKETKITEEPTIIPVNYKADEYVGWFMSDAEKLRNWATRLFASNVVLGSTTTETARQAAENSLTEIEDDVTKIREFLQTYIPINKKDE